MTWKKCIGAIALTICVLVAGCSDDKLEEQDVQKEIPDKDVYEVSQESAFDAVVSYIGMIYFNESSYEEFTKLYMDSAKAPKESTFENFRKISKPEERFGSTDLASFKENLKVEKIDENSSIVYYVMNSLDNKEQAVQTWKIALKDAKWYLVGE